MKDIFSQASSLASMMLIPFIPNYIMRYLALVLASLLSAAYLASHTGPTSQVAWLAESIKKTDESLSMANKECITDPQFLFEAGLKLTEMKYAVSTLHTKVISMKYVAWTKYAHRLGRLSLSINECRREIKDLQASILLALECARQQKFEDDINHMTATLVSTFPEGPSGSGTWSLRMRASRLTRRAALSDQLLLSV
ncbi:hypothetical protein FB451DRAFT_1236969 [Mycena latifolia]|nr:hypothetical protein FB451DRAFT_1236969 [Mycena latifolia]